MPARVATGAAKLVWRHKTREHSRMSARSRCFGLLAVIAVAVLAPAPGSADDATTYIGPSTMGRFLGYTLMCRCLPYDEDYLQGVYYALFVDWQDETYADQMMGFLHSTMQGDYRDFDLFCQSKVCPNDYTIYLRDVVSMIDLDKESVAFQANYRHAVEGLGPGDGPRVVPATSWRCKLHPDAPRCARETTASP